MSYDALGPAGSSAFRFCPRERFQKASAENACAGTYDAGMNRVVRYMSLPALSLAVSIWMLHAHWAAAPILLVIAICALIFGALASMRIAEPVTLGTNVMFDDESGRPLVGRVVALDRTSLVVRVMQ